MSAVQVPEVPRPVTQEVIKPGVDSQAHVNNMQDKLASALNNVYNLNVQAEHLKPESQKSPITPELDHVMKKPPTDLDFEDTMAGWKGRPRTEASGNFLKVWMNRLKKKNPDHDIESA